MIESAAGYLGLETGLAATAIVAAIYLYKAAQLAVVMKVVAVLALVVGVLLVVDVVSISINLEQLRTLPGV